MTIAGWTFGIHQAAAGCSTAIDSPGATVGPAAGTGSVHVTAGGGCAWTAVSNDAWIRVTSGASGSGGGTVAYAFEANSGGPRAGTLTVAGRTFSLGQSGPCPASIAPSGASFDETGGAGALVVTTHTGCPWTAVSDVPWITLTSGTSGTGSGTVGYLVAAGPPRNGTLTVAGRPFTVRQNPKLAEALDVDTSWRLLSSSPAWFGQTAVTHDGSTRLRAAACPTPVTSRPPRSTRR